MDVEILKLVAQSGSAMLILAIVLFYLGKYIVPKLISENRTTVDNILLSHERSFDKLSGDVDGLARQMRNHGRISLIQTLISQGQAPDVAEREANRIILNGGSS